MSDIRDAKTDQPLPKEGQGPAVGILVKADIDKRMAIGRKKYGRNLQAFNGRDALEDAYDEALDLCMYLRQAIEEGRAIRRREAQAPLTTFPENSLPFGD